MVQSRKKNFKLHKIKDHLQVELASFHLEGDAEIWFDMLQEQQEVLSWKKLKEAMNLQFEPSVYEDFFGDLIRLSQESSVNEYTIKFNRLITRAGYMTETQKISSYTCGLKAQLRMEVKARKPETLLDAQGLATQSEDHVDSRYQQQPYVRSSRWSNENKNRTYKKDFDMRQNKGETSDMAQSINKEMLGGRKFTVK